MQKLTQGEIVTVRRRRWRVLNVRSHDDCRLVALARAERTTAGATLSILEPFDRVERVVVQPRLRRVGIRRWRHRARALLADAAPPGALKAARLARIDLLPHQLEPALAVLRGQGTRVLLADEVGLGKTVQAALIVAELRLRGAADRVLILTPASLRTQWANELRERLRIHADIVDMAGLRRRAAALAVDVNPWQTMSIAIASFDYVKRPEVLPAVAACHWDVIVVDEVHNVATDSDRHSAVASLAARTPYVLLLTATPHSGDGRAFRSVCALGAAGDDTPLLFRRTRQNVQIGTRRRVHQLPIRLSAAEARMHALLARFILAARREHGDRTTLAASVLQKRALSSARSLERSVGRRLARLEAGVGAAAEQLALPLDDPAGELTRADEEPEWSEELALADPSRERRLLGELAAAARHASLRETKIAALVRLLRRAGEPAVVFTEYRDTLVHLRASLSGPVAMLHGGLNRDERTASLEAFSNGAAAVLLATDAAAEGLNLHRSCRLVVNLELPWNPMRLEQRIGRVDRIGQARTVHAVHFVARGTMESKILRRLRERIVRGRRDIDMADPIGLNLTDAADSQVSETSEGAPSPIFERPDLRLESMSEAARLLAARARWDNGAVPEGSAEADAAAWMARTRRWSTRVGLAGRCLSIYRATIEDGDGQVTETALVPALLSLGTLRASDVERAARAPQTRAALERALDEWRGHAAATQHAFQSARLAREHAIAAASLPRSASALQPGLFDRRAEARHEAAARERQTDSDERARRVAAIERALALVQRDPELLLVLAP